MCAGHALNGHLEKGGKDLAEPFHGTQIIETFQTVAGKGGRAVSVGEKAQQAILHRAVAAREFFMSYDIINIT